MVVVESAGPTDLDLMHFICGYLVDTWFSTAVDVDSYAVD